MHVNVKCDKYCELPCTPKLIYSIVYKALLPCESHPNFRYRVCTATKDTTTLTLIN